MRILMVTGSLPYPPASGGALRALGILRGLHEHGHKVTLLSYGEGTGDDTPLVNYCERIEIATPPTRTKIQRLVDLVTGKADISQRLYDEAFKARLLALLGGESFDMVQFEGIEIACFLLDVRKAYPDLSICFDTFNAEAQLQRNIYDIDRQTWRRLPMALYSWIQSRRLLAYEGALCRASDLVIAVSNDDAVLLGEYTPGREVSIVPSGIQVADYQGVTALQLPERAIVFTGKMDYRPNVDAMLWFYEAIWGRLRDVHLVIVGQKPHERLSPLLDDDRVMITGWVDSVPPFLHGATVYIAPLRMGSGTRLKLLEALASGCAIVATTQAVAGLNEVVRDAMLIRDDEGAFAEAIQLLLDDEEARKTLQAKASAVVGQYYDWSVLIPQLLSAYERTLHG